MKTVRANRRMLVMALAILAMCAIFAGVLIYRHLQSAEETVTDTMREQICLDFVKTHMLTEQGGVRTNYLDHETEGELAAGAQVLSESMGLIMEYAVSAGDAELMQSAFRFVRDYLDTGKILSYRYSPNSGAYAVNALIDDLRILRVLLTAGEPEEYRDAAMTYSGRLYGTNVRDGYAYDMYDEQYAATNHSITLCYIDLNAMLLLAQDDARWAAVEKNMREIAAGGYLGDAFPLYADAYDYAADAYDAGDIHTVQSLLTVLHLAQTGACPEQTLRYLKDRIENGAIYGAYHPSGTPANNIQSTAIYAICARIFSSAGDGDMSRRCIRRMNAFQVLDPYSELYGAFADAGTKQAYSFDNLWALLAYRQE